MKNYNLIKVVGRVVIITLSILVISSCKKKETTPTECPVVETPDPTSVTDIDGNVYPVARICGQLWMTENLRTTRYNDGTTIPTGLTTSAWGSATTGAYAIYNSTVVTTNTSFGKLYNWYAVNSGKLAPAGWHVASETEWAALVNCLGGSAVAGGKMKSTSLFWNSPNVGADNSSGFNALPSGYIGTTGGYSLLGDAAYFWASGERNLTQGEYLSLNTNQAASFQNGATKTFGYAIRCIKD